MRAMNEMNPVAQTADQLTATSLERVTDVIRYHELSEKPVVEMDSLELLNANIASLEDLTARFQFVMREVRYMMKA